MRTNSASRAKVPVGFRAKGVPSRRLTGPVRRIGAEAHRHAVENVFPRIGESCTTAEILALLKP